MGSQPAETRSFEEVRHRQSLSQRRSLIVGSSPPSEFSSPFRDLFFFSPVWHSSSASCILLFVHSFLRALSVDRASSMRTERGSDRPVWVGSCFGVQQRKQPPFSLPRVAATSLLATFTIPIIVTDFLQFSFSQDLNISRGANLPRFWIEATFLRGLSRVCTSATV